MDKKILTRDSVVVRSRELVSSEIDDEIVMMSIENGKYYGLNEVGSCIWRMLEKPHSVADIIKQILLDYEVDPAACEEDVMRFLRQLDDDNILEIE